jgi:AraC-like DNA-binding protein
MDDQEAAMSAAYPEIVEVKRDIRGSSAQHPRALTDVDLRHGRDHWMKIDTILDLVRDHAPDCRVPPPSATAIGVFPRVNPVAPAPCPQESFAGALFLAMNEALLGSPRRLERFLPSDPTIEQLLRARGAASEMATEQARRYLRFLYSAIVTWAAAHEAINWSIQQRSLTPLPKWRFIRVRKYIDLHIEEPIRLRDLAKVAGLSRMHFAAQFRAYTGTSPGKFVMGQRITHAQVLLGDPRNRLAEVALSVGFQNQAHFTTVFHRLVGKTPNSWRKMLSHEDSGVIEHNTAPALTLLDHPVGT